MMEYVTSERLKKLAREKNSMAVAKSVLELQTSDKFRLAAELLDLNKAELAEMVGTRACQEIKLAILFSEPQK